MARPLKYKTVAELEAAIDEYFKSCEGHPIFNNDGNVICNKRGEPIIIGEKPPTVTGLALSLGFSTRQSLLNYQGRKQFLDTITRAKSRCEEYAESRLYDRDGSRGAEFSLKYNFKWDVDNSGPADTEKEDDLSRSLRELGKELESDEV